MTRPDISAIRKVIANPKYRRGDEFGEYPDEFWVDHIRDQAHDLCSRVEELEEELRLALGIQPAWNVFEEVREDRDRLAKRVEELEAALRVALEIADSANRTTDMSAALSDARDVLGDAHGRPLATPDSSEQP